MDQVSVKDIYYVLFVGTAGMLVLSGGAIVLMLTIFRKTQKAKEEKYQLEKAHQEQLVYTTIQTLENERKRFARDIHDEIGVNLSTISMQMKGLHVIKSESEKNGRINEIGDIIEQSISSARRIAHNLIPPGLEKFGLHHILSEQTERIAKSSSLKIEIHSEENLMRPSPDAELMLYRIIQELLNNTIKYAQATLVTISFTMVDGYYELAYTDNGKGFDMIKEEGVGLGLRNIESRIKMIGAISEYQSSKDAGMSLRIRIKPVEA